MNSAIKGMVIKYAWSRLTEVSTLRGIILSVGGMIGMTLTPEQTSSAVWVLLTIVGLVGSFAPDTLGVPQSIKDRFPNMFNQESKNDETSELVDRQKFKSNK